MIATPVRVLGGLIVLAGLLACRSAYSAAQAEQRDTDTQSSSANARRHVPSPDWRDQIIYFAMIDRFEDGDARNNDQGAGEFDRLDGAKFSGGDLAGITRRLDYIRGLGATALWITPPVANRWWDERAHYGGYHGYWAENFMRVDRHFGSLADYQQLSRALHAAGMYLVQDIVLNHTGNYFVYGSNWKAGDPIAGYARNPDAQDRSAPTQSPFDRNDPRDPGQRQAGIYHWTPAIRDFNDRQQELNFQLADLDDLNTENAQVRAALRKSYACWIDAVGVDAFRVDTAFYVPPDFLRDFLYADERANPGILRVAQRSGRKQFHVFGEGFGVEKPYTDTLSQKIDSYMRSTHDTPAALPAMLNFPLYGAIADVFARGRPTAELGYRIRRMMQLHQRPHLMPSFVDNHDVDRFLAGGSIAGLKQALLSIMTLPGIPTLYYGTEQGLTVQRAAMFSAGFGAESKNHFDADAPLYQYLQRAIALRRAHRLFSRGVPTILQDSRAGPGVLVYKMTYRNETALVALNSADNEVLMDNLDAGLARGTRLKGLFAIDNTPEELIVDAERGITRNLPARSGFVWLATSRGKIETFSPAGITLDPLPANFADADFVVSGSAAGVSGLELVLDGQLSAAQMIVPDADGRWSATVDTQSMIDPTIEHRIVAWSRSPSIASTSRSFRVARSWKLLVSIEDPDGDDHGPNGRYQYPSDDGWRTNRPMDIHGIRIWASGGSLKIDLRMNKVTALWNAPNGFDHVAFTFFIQMPKAIDGSKTMPLQHAELPDGMRWNYRLRAGGWSNALYSAAGASASNEGAPVVPAAEILVDDRNDSMSFAIPASALGRVTNWSGARIYVTTWDYDGGYRQLKPEAQPGAIGGGDGTRDPLIMDDSAVITLP